MIDRKKTVYETLAKLTGREVSKINDEHTLFCLGVRGLMVLDFVASLELQGLILCER